MNNIDGPCYMCEDRNIYCHTFCEKYLKWAEKCRKINEELRLKKENDVWSLKKVQQVIRSKQRGH